MNDRSGLEGDIGRALYDLARRPEVEKVLEIGTYDGEGSTYFLANGLSRTTGRLQSIEADEGLYRRATDFYAGSGLPVELHSGLTVRVEDYRPFEEYLPRIERTVHETEVPGTHRTWYENELALARAAKERDLLRTMVRRDRWYDMVLLDGGEFTAETEFHLLEPCVAGYIVLDGTNPDRSIKNAANREWLHWSPDWAVVVDEQEDRCGWCVAKRR